jgi:ubiquitin
MVHEFVYQYEKALDACYIKEKEKDIKTKTSRPILKTCYKMEVQAANVYTRKSFFMFQ